MDMRRRSFFKFLTGAAAIAPTVKAAVEMPPSTTAPPEWIRGMPVAASSYIESMLDVQDSILYDRIRFAPGMELPHSIHFFNTPIGQICPYTGSRKTLRHTNMHMAGRLPAPNGFLVQRILFAVHPTTAEEDLQALQSEAYWEFQLGQKIMSRGPMLLNGPALAGLRDLVTPDGKPVENLPDEVIATARHNITTGGTLIPAQCYFQVEMRHDDGAVHLLDAKHGGHGLDLMIAFQGPEARGIQ